MIYSSPDTLKKFRSSLAITAVLLMTIAGCTSQPYTDEKVTQTLAEKSLTKGETVDEIRNYQVKSWQYVDSRHIILEARVKDFYLISLRVPCVELSSALRIGFTSRQSTLTKFESIIVHQTGSGVRNCPIDDMTQLVSTDTDHP